MLAILADVHLLDPHVGDDFGVLIHIWEVKYYWGLVLNLEVYIPKGTIFVI